MPIKYIDCPTHEINILDTTELKLSPTLNRKGVFKNKFDIFTFIELESNIINMPVIMLSDVHSHGFEVIEHLEKICDLSQYDIITCGDMAGEPEYGSDGDPTKLYQLIKSKCKNLYIVQGNHDLPPQDIDELFDIINDDKNPCVLSDGLDIRETSFGTLGGVHGTVQHGYMQNPSKYYKKDAPHYYALVQNILEQKPYIFATHDMPSLEYYDEETNSNVKCNGKEELFNIVNKLKPVMHIYGHGYHENFITFINKTYFVNLEHRILIWNPIDCDILV